MSSAPIFNDGPAEQFLPWLYQNIEYPKSALKDDFWESVCEILDRDCVLTVTVQFDTACTLAVSII
jgi:hypothetical protein